MGELKKLISIGQVLLLFTLTLLLVGFTTVPESASGRLGISSPDSGLYAQMVSEDEESSSVEDSDYYYEETEDETMTDPVIEDTNMTTHDDESTYESEDTEEHEQNTESEETESDYWDGE